MRAFAGDGIDLHFRFAAVDCGADSDQEGGNDEEDSDDIAEGIHFLFGGQVGEPLRGFDGQFPEERDAVDHNDAEGVVDEVDDGDLQGEDGIDSGDGGGGEECGDAGADVRAEAEGIDLAQGEYAGPDQGDDEAGGGGAGLDEGGHDGAGGDAGEGAAADGSVKNGLGLAYHEAAQEFADPGDDEEDEDDAEDGHDDASHDRAEAFEHAFD